MQGGQRAAFTEQYLSPAGIEKCAFFFPFLIVVFKMRINHVDE
jgi:hypothetical protein